MALPEHVASHLAAEAVDASDAAVAVDEPKTLLATLADALKRLMAMAAGAEATSQDQSQQEGQQAECCGDNGTGYGYPPAPAYGVPVNVAVQLLQRTFALLTKILQADEITDALQAELESLLTDIAAALGVAAEGEQAVQRAKRRGVWQLIQEVFQLQIPTEPLVTPAQAADELEDAYNGLFEVANDANRTGDDIKEAFLNLRVAIRKAVRTLRTIAAQEVMQEMGVKEQEVQQPASQPEVQVEQQAAETSEMAAASDAEQGTPKLDDAVIERITALEQRIAELQSAINQLLAAPKVRSTMFATSESRPQTIEEVARAIREQYFAAKSEDERRLLRQQAERLIAEAFFSTRRK